MSAATVVYSATNLCDSALNKITNAKIWFQPMLNGQPTSYRIGGGGTAMKGAVSADVVNGGFSLALPDTTATDPHNIGWAVTVISNITGLNLLGPGYSNVQNLPGTPLSLDNYIPDLSGQVAYQPGPAGPPGSSGLVGLNVANPTAAGDYHAATTDDVIIFAGSGDCFVSNGSDATGRERLTVNATGRVIRVAADGVAPGVTNVQFVNAGESLRWIKGPSGWMPQQNNAFVTQVGASGTQLTSNRLYFANLGGAAGSLLLPVDSTWEGYEKVTVYNFGGFPIALTFAGSTVATLPGACAITLIFDGAIWAIISSTIPAALNAPLNVNQVAGGDYNVSSTDLVVIYSGTGAVFLNVAPVGIEQVVINATGRVLQVSISGHGVQFLQDGESVRAIGTSTGPVPLSNQARFTQENTPGAQLTSGRIYVANLGGAVGTLLLPVDSTWEGYEQITVYNYGSYGIQLMSGGAVSLLLPPGGGATLLYVGFWVVLSSSFSSTPALSLSTSGTSGPATLSGTNLNIPQYGGGSTPSIAAVSHVTDYQSYGDSFTGATGATEYAKGFSQRLAAQFRGAFSQLGFGGDEACDLSYRVHAGINLQPSALPLVTILIGHNDVQFIGNTANGLAKYGASLTAALAHAALPSTCKVYGRAATLTGTFAANSALASNADGIAPGAMNTMAVTGTGHGDTATFSLTTAAANQAVYVAWFASDGDGGSATLSIDGSVVDTLTTQGPGGTIATVNGGTHAVFAKRYVVAAAGSHTLVLTINSATASGNSFTFLWAGTPNPANVSSSPARIFALDPAYQAGLALKSTTDAYIGVLAPLAAQLATDGLPVLHLATNSFLNNSLGMSTTPTVAPDGTYIPASTTPGLHPNDYGHAQIAAMVAGAASPSQPLSSAVMRRQRTIRNGSGTYTIGPGDQVLFLSGFTTATLQAVGADEQEHFIYNFGSSSVTVSGYGGSWPLAAGTGGLWINGGGGFIKVL